MKGISIIDMLFQILSEMKREINESSLPHIFMKSVRGPDLHNIT